MADLLMHPPNRRRRLRELLATRRPVLAPGSHDALSARLAEQAGFDVVYMGGFATTASLLGRPDIGLLGGTVERGFGLALGIESTQLNFIIFA